ncbi:MAG: ABC transporter substrate-binding protein [Geminicoccaceae bacterium]
MHVARRAALAAIAAVAWAGPVPAQDRPLIAVTAIVEHPALDATRDGVKEALAAEGFVDGETITFRYESAQGNSATAVQIARKFVGEAPAVIVPISTPSAQAVVAATGEIPVVFSSVTDPVGAKLVANPEHPGGNVTGMSNMTPMNKHLDLIREILPELKVLGVVYNPGEVNSRTLVRLLEAEAPARGITVVEAPANRSAEVQSAAQSLVGRAEAIYVPTDNTVVSAFEALVQVGRQNKLPVIAGDIDSVPRGAIAAVGFDYLDVGRQTGRMVARVLRGEKPGDIPVEYAQTLELAVNPGAAEAMGVALPEALVARADIVVK